MRRENSTNNNNNNQRKKVVVPASLLLQFFSQSTMELQRRHLPQAAAAQQKKGTTITSHELDDNITLSDHQASILELQRRILKDNIDNYNNNRQNQNNSTTTTTRNDDDDLSLTLDDVQNRLRELGNNNTENISLTNDDDDISNLFSGMNRMNDTARLAFAKSVLLSEWNVERGRRWLLREGCGNNNNSSSSSETMDRCVEMYERRKSRIIRSGSGGDDGEEGMDPLDMLQFCGLCVAAVQLSEVKEYLSTGRCLLGDDTMMTDEFHDSEFIKRLRGVIGSSSLTTAGEGPSTITSMTPFSRMVIIEHFLSQAVGYDLKYAMTEIQRLATTTTATSDIRQTFDEFVSTISSAVHHANLASGNETLPDENLSDYDQGGVTKVVSVKYSERIVGGDDAHGFGSTEADAAPPQAAAMEQQMDHDQKRQLETAKRAAALQERLLSELRAMDEECREKELSKAKVVHDLFVEEAMARPVGRERVAFMQSVDEGTKRFLIMYKLWEQVGDDKMG